MNLKQVATEAYEREQKRLAEQERERASKFAERATAQFADQMGVGKGEVGFCAVNATTAVSYAQGYTQDIEVEARWEFNAIEFYAVFKCPTCDNKGYIRVATLADIGRAVKDGWAGCPVCNMLPFEMQLPDEPLVSDRDEGEPQFVQIGDRAFNPGIVDQVTLVSDAEVSIIGPQMWMTFQEAEARAFLKWWRTDANVLRLEVEA